MSEQAFAALDKANRVRVEAARVKKGIKVVSQIEGAHMVADYLEGDDIESITIGGLLTSIHFVGYSRAEDLLHNSGITEASLAWRVSRLTDEQRENLALYLRGYYARATN